MSGIKKYKSGKRTYTKFGGKAEQITVAGKPKQADVRNPELNVNIDENMLPGRYSDGFMINSSNEEFIIDFFKNTGSKQKVQSRVIISPANTMKLCKLIRDTLAKSGKI